VIDNHQPADADPRQEQDHLPAQPSRTRRRPPAIRPASAVSAGEMASRCGRSGWGKRRSPAPPCKSRAGPCRTGRISQAARPPGRNLAPCRVGDSCSLFRICRWMSEVIGSAPFRFTVPAPVTAGGNPVGEKRQKGI
jgi:hypothetical protein